MLQLSKTDKVILGVCGALAESTDTKATWWRLGFVLGFVLFGGGAIAYLGVAAVSLILNSLHVDVGENSEEFTKQSRCCGGIRTCDNGESCEHESSKN